MCLSPSFHFSLSILEAILWGLVAAVLRWRGKSKVQYARDRATEVCAWEKGLFLGLVFFFFFSLYLVFLLGGKCFHNKAIVLPQLNTIALLILTVNVLRTNLGGKSIHCFQEQLI